MVKDSNHTLQYLLIKTKRLFRDNARDHLLDTYNAIVDATNAAARTVLGILVVFFTISAELCARWQQYWVRGKKNG